MKTNLETLDVLQQLIQKIAESQWKSGKTVLRVERFARTVSDIVQPFRAAKGKLLAQFVEPAANGQMTIKPSHPRYAEFVEEYRSIADEMVDLKFTCLIEDADIERCESLNVSPNDMAFLRSLGVVAETIGAGNAKIGEWEAAGGKQE